ncbi:DUF6790 family protein [Geodermatophilus sp. SYSU D00079]
MSESTDRDRHEAVTRSAQGAPHRAEPLLGLLPYIGVLLFVASAVPVVFGDRTGPWQQQLVENGVVYMIGWAAIGAGISHVLFGPRIARSIGWGTSPFQFEVGVANLGFGVAGVLATSYSSEYWLAVIIASSVFRVGCGIGHIRQMVQHHDFAVNNTSILVLDFGVPAALVVMYALWAP